MIWMIEFAESDRSLRTIGLAPRDELEHSGPFKGRRSEEGQETKKKENKVDRREVN